MNDPTYQKQVYTEIAAALTGRIDPGSAALSVFFVPPIKPSDHWGDLASAILGSCYHASKLGGFMAIIVGDKFNHDRSSISLNAGAVDTLAGLSGWRLTDRRVWAMAPDQNDPAWSSSSYTCGNDLAYILIYCKGADPVFDRSRLADREWLEWGRRGVWHTPPSITQLPLVLPRRLIRLLTARGSVVFDPYVSSDSICVACDELDRHYVGVNWTDKKRVSDRRPAGGYNRRV